MRQKEITAVIEQNPFGIISIDKNLFPKGYRVKQILSSRLESNLSFYDILQKKRFIVTLLLDECEDSDKNSETEEIFSVCMNPYI